MILNELDAIQSRSMQKVHGVGYGGSPELLRRGDGFKINYYRRSTDGSLIRAVTLSSGETKKWVAAPPPDFSESEIPEYIIEAMKDSWKNE